MPTYTRVLRGKVGAFVCHQIYLPVGDKKYHPLCISWSIDFVEDELQNYNIEYTSRIHIDIVLGQVTSTLSQEIRSTWCSMGCWCHSNSVKKCEEEGQNLHCFAPPLKIYFQKLQDIPCSDRGDFWALLVEILVFASPTSYMFTSSGFSLLNWVYSIDSSKIIGNFLAVLNFNRLFLKLYRFICNY